MDIKSPFHAAAPDLIKKGLIVLPLTGKAPLISRWTSASLEDSKEFLKKDTLSNIGLLLGQKTGIIALDFDNDVGDLHKKIFKICGRTPIVKRGAKGGTLFFRYNGEKNKKWHKDGQTIVELLSTGNQTVIPPSIHPETGKEYVYTTKDTLSSLDALMLPLLPMDFVERVNELFEEDGLFVSKTEKIIAALKFIVPEDYDTWIKVGMAIKEDLGDEAFSVWADWSKTHPKCKEEELLPKWSSFEGSGITSATIFKMAAEKGFTNRDATAFFNIEEARGELKKWRERGRVTGLSTGMEAFDNFLHIREKELTVITGTPNSGKSEFLDYLAFKLNKIHQTKTLFLSFEKDPIDHIESFLHRITGKSYQTREPEEEAKALEIIKRSYFFYNHPYESRDIDTILEKAKQIISRKGVKIMVIDPFSYITSKEIANEFQHVRYICIKLADFAKRNKLHIFLVAHPKTLENRKFAGKPQPLTLYSISGGATFFNKCDNGILISRDENELCVDIQKVRKQEVDKTGSFLMKFDKLSRSFITYENNF
jgi:KaiC/GvpD/RAD55 family RecA-like ATPase